MQHNANITAQALAKQLDETPMLLSDLAAEQESNLVNLTNL